MITMLFCFIFWILFAFTEGVREAYVKHEERNSRIQKLLNLQIIIIIQRILILLICYWNIFGVKPYLGFVHMIAMILIFTYINNGTYFVIRNKLNPDIFIKKDKSNCDIKIDRPMVYLDFFLRKNLFIIGLIIEMISWVLSK